MLYRARGKGNWLTGFLSSRRVQPWKTEAGQAGVPLGPLATWRAQPLTGAPQGRPDAHLRQDTEFACLGDLEKFPWVGAGPGREAPPPPSAGGDGSGIHLSLPSWAPGSLFSSRSQDPCWRLESSVHVKARVPSFLSELPFSISQGD